MSVETTTTGQGEAIERRGEDMLAEVFADLTRDDVAAENALEDAYKGLFEICDLLGDAHKTTNEAKAAAVDEVWGQATRLLCAVGDVKRRRY